MQRAGIISVGAALSGDKSAYMGVGGFVGAFHGSPAPAQGDTTATQIPAAIVAPSLSSNATAPLVGYVLHCNRGTWSGGGITFTFQWHHTSDDSNALGAGATTQNYTVDPSDDGDSVYCEVIATNILGSGDEYTFDSGVVTTPVAAPVFSVNPSMTSSGDLANPLVGDVITVSPGTASGSPSYTYQMRHGSDNSNATGSGAATSSYTVDATDVGDTLYCHVTATNGAGSATADTAASGVVAAFVSDVNSDTADTTGWTADSDIRSADGGIAATVVTPADLAGVQVWLGTTGAAAGTWPDLSGNGNDFTQATGANQPAITPAAYNGKQVRTFDGSNDIMSGSTVITLTDFTIALAFKCPGFAASFDVQYPVVAAYNQPCLTLNNIGRLVSVQNAGVSVMAASSTNMANNLHLVVATYDSTANETKIYIDGALDTTGSTDETFVHTNPFSVGSGFIGDIAHLAIFDRVLADTSAERRGIEDYIGNELGITITH
jgi:hypothetical protein